MRFVLQPKAQIDTRTYTVDFSPFVPVGYSLQSATGSCIVSTGTDPSASSRLINIAVDSTGYGVTFQFQSGVDGVIYQIYITGSFAPGTPYTGTTVTQMGYLAVQENQ